MARFFLAVVCVGLMPTLLFATPSTSECAAGSSSCGAEVPPDPRTVEEVEAVEEAEVELMDVRLLQRRAQAAPAQAAATKTQEAAGEEDGKKVVEEEASFMSHDHNGRACLFCGKPLPGRLGGKSYTEFRTDCGGHSSSSGPTAESLKMPVAHFTSLKSSVGAQTNGFCELNFQKSCADAISNQDYLYWAKSLDLKHPTMQEYVKHDARYCQLNGFLERDIVALQHNFTGMRSKARELCDTKFKKHGVEKVTFTDMLAKADPEDPNGPSLDEAETLAAWSCAMGDLGCDMAMCSYSFCKEKQGAGTLGLYAECAGWDPVHGMPF